MRDKQREWTVKTAGGTVMGRAPAPRMKTTSALSLFNGHLQTVVPSILRRVRGVRFRRERMITEDDDFLDLDWSRIGAGKLAVVSHGMEGNSRRPYVLGMVKALKRGRLDARAWNLRGCSGEPNRQLRFYHAGATDDLAAVIGHALSRGTYEAVVLVGFSLGGNWC